MDGGPLRMASEHFYALPGMLSEICWQFEDILKLV